MSPLFAICVFLGYENGQKGYRCYDPIKNKTYVCHYVVFLEHLPFYSLSSSLHTHIKSELIHIDPFSFNDDISSDCNVENYEVDATVKVSLLFPRIPNNLLQLLIQLHLQQDHHLHLFHSSSALSFL